jgi:chitin disaccharide deacetylase
LQTPCPSRRRSHTKARSPRCARKNQPNRYLIVNADDLGADDGTTRGIIAAHERGIVTSASLMVDMPGARAAARAAQAHSQLGLGLHVSFTAGRRIADLGDLRALRRELERQLDLFVDLTGQDPTHIDSHHHVHRRAELSPLFVELCRNRRIPLRGFSGITYVGNFYGQWELGKTDLRYISPDYLISLLRNTAPGFSELACHPGDRDAGFDPVYDWQRRIELESLTDPRVSAAATRERIRLISYREYSRLAPASRTGIPSYSPA